MFKEKRRAEDEMSIEEQDSYEQWRVLLLEESILSDDGLIDLERLEKKHPGELDKQQVIWIEAMQKGEVIDEASAEDESDEEVKEEPEEIIEAPAPAPAKKKVIVEEPPAPKKEIPSKKKVKEEKVEPEPAEPEEEAEEIDDSTEDELTPPPPPGSAKKKIESAERTFAEGDTFNIQVEADGEPEEVSVVKIAKDGIHLSSSLNEDTEYLVDPEELQEMIVE